MTKVEDAFAAVGVTSKGVRIRDDWIEATCPSCGQKTNLGGAQIRQNGQQTEYLCPRCSKPYVIVGPAPGLAGYRLGDNVVNPLGGFELRLPPPESTSN
jgi:predicted RNA-binding Zn-ribbon protein involved in translation (DUF1610 family)